MKRLLTFLSTLCCLSFNLQAQNKTSPSSLQERMQWFQDGKLGVFIHWGIYSVKESMKVGAFTTTKYPTKTIWRSSMDLRQVSIIPKNGLP
jgi:hypothetical protein